MKKKISVIGSGFSSLAASCYLAKAGYDVTIYEKNHTIGGRARQLHKEGFTFDIGPPWYWMPGVFERFFNDFGTSSKNFYQLEKLSPAYKVYFGNNDTITIDDNLQAICNTFENIEKGSGAKLKRFIESAQSNYDIAIKDLVYRPGDSILELITPQTTLKVNQFFSTITKDVKSTFKDRRLQQILEFLFYGESSEGSASQPKPLGLRYSFVTRTADGRNQEISAAMAARSSEPVRMSVEATQESYVQLLQNLGSAGTRLWWPPQETGKISLKLQAGKRSEIPMPPPAENGLVTVIVRLSSKPFGPLTMQEVGMLDRFSANLLIETASPGVTTGVQEKATYVVSQDPSTSAQLAVEIPIAQ